MSLKQLTSARVLAAGACLGVSSFATAQTPPLVLDTVATGLGQVNSMAFFARDSALVVTHRRGVMLLDVTTGRHTPVPGMPQPVNLGEAGTIDIALHPDFATNRQVYVSLVLGTRTQNGIGIVRARFTGAAFTDTATIFRTAPLDTTVQHFGGRLAFGAGHLFVSTGDRYHSRPLVQDLSAHHGKILRLLPDGRVPRDNPFVGRAGARPEIWSFGHRNVQGLAYDSIAGVLWAHEHGPRGGDEVNRIEPGRNYGWPRNSWGFEYEGGAIDRGVPADTAVASPRWVWSPSIAPSGMRVYSGRAIPSWRGNLLIGAMQSPVIGQHVNRLSWNGERFVGEERLFAGRVGRVRFVTEDSRGLIYVGNDDGHILRIRPADQPPPTVQDLSFLIGNWQVTFNWYDENDLSRGVTFTESGTHSCQYDLPLNGTPMFIVCRAELTATNGRRRSFHETIRYNRFLGAFEKISVFSNFPSHAEDRLFVARPERRITFEGTLALQNGIIERYVDAYTFSEGYDSYERTLSASFSNRPMQQFDRLLVATGRRTR